MKKELLLSKNILYTLVLVGFLLNFFTLRFDFTSWGIPEMAENVLINLGLLASFVATVVLIIDVFKNDVNGKYLWTLAFLLSGGLLGFFYLRSREYYLKSSK